jgi:multidrug resistance efflux pump
METSNNTHSEAQHGTTQPQHAQPKAKQGVPKKGLIVLLLIFLVGGAAGLWYYIDQSKYIYSDRASVNVPLIQLTPKSAGILKEVYVHEGQQIQAHQTVARVGDDIITAEIPGIVATVKQDIGANYTSSQPVVTMYDPTQMRIVVSIDEDKGLNEIKLLQKVKFTVDAFGSQQFYGFVQEISPSNHAGDVVFNISDKRQVQQFDVKIRYSLTDYPNFKNGMSAKVWIIK